MKRLFIFLLLVALALIPVKLWADAEFTSTVTPKAATLDYVSGGGVAVTDAANGYTQRVDDTGAAYVKQKANAVAFAEGATLNAGTALVSAACRVSSITFGGPVVAAGSYVLIYDAITATGTQKFDISIGTTKGVQTIVIPGGVAFATGVFADSNASDAGITITYDN